MRYKGYERSDSRTGPLKIMCLKCGVAVGERCKTKSRLASGVIIDITCRPHRDRFHAWDIMTKGTVSCD